MDNFLSRSPSPTEQKHQSIPSADNSGCRLPIDAPIDGGNDLTSSNENSQSDAARTNFISEGQSGEEEQSSNDITVPSQQCGTITVLLQPYSQGKVRTPVNSSGSSEKENDSTISKEDVLQNSLLSFQYDPERHVAKFKSPDDPQECLDMAPIMCFVNASHITQYESNDNSEAFVLCFSFLFYTFELFTLFLFFLD